MVKESRVVMNIVEPIFWQARNCPSQVALAAPGTPFSLVSYSRLVIMVTNACRRLGSFDLRAGDRVVLKVRDPLFRAILTVALARLGIIVIPALDGDDTYPFEVAAVVSDASHQSSTGRNILADYNWVAEAGPETGQQNYPAVDPRNLCCVLADPGEERQASRRFYALTHDLLGARTARHDVFFGASISAAPRLFDADGCTTPIGFELLFATLTRGAALFLMGDPTASFNALDTFQVESAVMTPQKLLDLVAFYEAKRDAHCGLKAIFVAGHVSQSMMERASRILGAKFSVGHYLTQPGMIASMPFPGGEAMNNASGIVLPGVTVEVVGDDGRQLETDAPGNIRYRSDLSAQIYGELRSDSSSFASNRRGYVTRDRLLVLEN